MNTTRQDSPPPPSRPRAMHFALAGLFALAALVGCAGPGAEKYARQDGSLLPQIRPLPLRVSGTQSSAAYYALGRYEYFNGQLERAEAAYRQAVQLDPNDPEPLNGLAVLHDRQGRFDQSAAEYRAALALAPDAPHILANLGYSLLLQRRADEAVAPLQRSAQLAPDNIVTRVNLARAEGTAEPATAVAAAGDAVGEVAVAPTPSTPVSTITVATTPVATAPVAATQVAATQVATTQVATTQVAATQVAATQVAKMPAPEATAGRPVPLLVAGSATAAVSQAKAEAVGRRMVSGVIGVSQPPLDATRGNVSLAAPMIASVQGAEAVPPIALREQFAGVRVEIANGNGVTGMARGLRGRLRKAGLQVTRTTNALPYNKRQTVIICQAALQDHAAALALKLAVSPRIIVGATRHLNVDLRVILGADFVRSASSPAVNQKLAMLDE